MKSNFLLRWRLGAALICFPLPASAQSKGDKLPASAPPVEITVVGTRVAQTPGSAHVVRSRELERLHYDDPMLVALTVPGVYVRQEDGMGLRPNIGLRGVNPDRSKKLTLMEDGILFGPAPYSAPAAYYFPLMARMTALRVIKGPAALVYGPQTIGGAIDLVTRPIPSDSAGFIDVAGGAYAYRKAHGYFGSSTEKLGFLIEGIHLGNDGFKQLPNDADTGFARNEWMVKSSYIVDPAARDLNELRLKISYSDEVSNETYLGLTDADFRANPYQRYPASTLDQMRNHRSSIVASHVFRSEAGLTLTTTLYRHDYARIWRKVNHLRGADELLGVLQAPDTPRNALFVDVLRGRADSSSPAETIFIGPNDRTFVSQGVQSVTRWNPVTGPLRQRLEMGVRIHNDSIDRRHSEDGFSMIGGALVPEGSPTLVTAFNRDSTTALALHALDAISYERLTLTPGVRVEVLRGSSLDRITGSEQTNLERVLLPGIGAYYGLNEQLGVLAGVYRGFSPPPPGSGPDVGPEHSTNYESGARFVSGRARAEAIGFYNDYANLTDICTESSGCSNANLGRQFDAGRARSYGLESSIAYELPVAGGIRLPFTAAYTLTYANFEETFESQDPIYGSVESGDELPYVPRHQLSTTFGAEHDRGGANAAVYYVSSMRETAGREPLSDVLSTDEQLWMDISAHVRPLKASRIYVDVRNVTGAAFIVSHRPFGARPNAPRWIQVGARVEF